MLLARHRPLINVDKMIKYAMLWTDKDHKNKMNSTTPTEKQLCELRFAVPQGRGLGIQERRQSQGHE